MGIGGALAEARSEAGLTINEVSQRTRIRATIIRDIERDDYSACGGDYYARGHIRAIARVVGTDPVPLIEEYDAARMPPPEPGAEDDTDPGYSDGTGLRLPGWHRRPGHRQDGNGAVGHRAASYLGPGPADQGPGGAADPGAASPGAASPGASPGAAWPGSMAPGTRPPGSRPPGSRLLSSRPLSSRPPGSARPGGAPPGGAPDGPESADTDPLQVAGQFPFGLTAAEAFRPSMPLKMRTRRRPNLTVILAVAVFVVLGVLIYLLVSGGSSPAAPPAKAPAHHPAAPARTHPSTTPAASSSPASTTAADSPVPLRIAGVSAFGPGGTAHGDDPSSARLATDGSLRSAWRSDWYATAKFGNLQSGTGLLLDMGSPVRATTARITLGSPGGSIELLAGSTPALAAMHVVATDPHPGGTVTMHVASPVRARYLLVWFTSLPPDSTGTYQAIVSNIAVSGTS